MLPNVWLGVSVENQAAADARVPVLLDTDAAVRFVSCEPLLGAVDLGPWLVESRSFHMCADIGGLLRQKQIRGCRDGERLLSPAAARAALLRLQAAGAKVISMDGCDHFSDQTGCLGHVLRPKLDWVIVGGESGHGAGVRPMHPDWARGIRDACGRAKVPFFFKQWGEWLPGTHFDEKHSEGDDPEQSKYACMDWPYGSTEPAERHSGLWADEQTEDATYRVGKKAAGRALDGRVWEEMPGGRGEQWSVVRGQ